MNQGINRLNAHRISFMLVLSLVALPPATADEKQEIWLTRLRNELGAATPDGTGVEVSQVESEDNFGNYSTWAKGDEWDGKEKLIIKSGQTGESNHAGNVGTRIFGSVTGIASGVTKVNAWETNHWLGATPPSQPNPPPYPHPQLTTSFLKTSTSSIPLVETADVQNNSWIGAFTSSSNDIDAIRRLDYTINRDDYVSVVGLNNGSSTDIPRLLAHAYNVISVGRTSGGHSQGLTTYDGTGRTKPDLVGPYDTTSGATAAVSGVAAILVETAGQTEARHSETIKAALLAGATKHEFADWDRTTSRPLDEVFGAGELNAYRSYQIVAAPQQEASLTQEVDLIGWDFVANPAANEHTYFFSVDESLDYLDELSVTLTWNRVITDGSSSGFRNLISTVADLSLELFEASDYTLASSLQLSNSPVDNVEHLYLTHLDPGQYAIRVSGAAGTDFALAWSGTDFGMMGDLNLDGIVDMADVDAFVDGWGAVASTGSLATWRSGDLNQDGSTTLSDFILLRDGLMKATGTEVELASLLATTGSAIPEPSSLFAAAIAAMGLFALHRFRPN